MRLRLPSWTNRVRVPLEGKKEAMTLMKTWRMWGIVSVMVVTGVAWAEDVTITTYYPSPRGVFDDIQFKRGEDYDDPANYYLNPNGTSKFDTLNVTTLNNLGDLIVTGAVQINNTKLPRAAW